MNPETGAGSYLISGGLNGGALDAIVTMTFLIGMVASAMNEVIVIRDILVAVSSISSIGVLASFIFYMLGCIGLICGFVAFAEMLDNYYYYLETGDLEAAYAIAETTKWEGVALAVNVIMDAVANRTFKKYTEKENAQILENLKGDGFKNNPLRQSYEDEVRALKSYGEELLASGHSEQEVAKILNQSRRDLGIKYKDMTPQPLRDYIYEINIQRYKDRLGPTYEWLVTEKGATDLEIIESASRPNTNIDALLSGFEEWLRGQ